MKMLQKMRKKAAFKFQAFSLRQKKILTWWADASPVKNREGIIADGAIRSGKTVSMATSFVMWAMNSFDGQNFGMCGKTVGSFRRNVWFWLKLILMCRGYGVHEIRNENKVFISKGNIVNIFYIFGGKDEGSQDLVQGITLAGVLFDEVALMPESFVNQATGRCSVEGSKFWFNCNPQGPMHWFKVNWIDKAIEKNIIYLHLTMEDNLSLSEKIKERYRSMYIGIFFKRYILGLWIMAEGAIYPEFNQEIHCIKENEVPDDLEAIYIPSDYGITNPMVYLKCGLKHIKNTPHFYIIDEYYNVKKDGSKTDVKFLDDYNSFKRGINIKDTIIDPSATSLINLFRQNNIHVKSANNSVIDGINNVSMWLTQCRIHIVKNKCPNLINEFSSYAWNEKASQKGEDEPLKENDHALDALRYLIQTLYPIRTSRAPIKVKM